MSQQTLKKWEWHGVNGTNREGTIGNIFLCIPLKDGAAKYTDFLDIYFENVGETWDGRKLNATVHFDSVVAQKYSTYTPENIPVCSIRVKEKGLGFLEENNCETIIFSTTITYADTGEVLDMPMLQSIYDVDIVIKSYEFENESWELTKGYTGDIWVWDGFEPQVIGNRIVANSPSGINYTGDDSWLRTGLVAPTENGQITSTVWLGKGIGSSFQLSLANDKVSDPVKESDGADLNSEGNIIKYTIKQKVGTFYGDTMVPYSSFVISDELPEGVTYQSAKVYDGSGNDITSKGTLSYSANTRKVAFSLGSQWLANIANYNGQTLTMEIVTKVDSPSVPMNTISNTGKISVDNKMTIESNTVTDIIAIPYKATYKYVSGTSGKSLPNSISTTSGDYKVSDSKTYYHGDIVQRQEIPKEGTKLEIKDSKGNLEGTWILSWDAESKTVDDSDIVFTGTWKYVPSPRLVIVKKIENSSEQFTWAHGEPTFLFKITGKDSGKVWYKSITFTQKAVEAVNTDGEYSGDNAEYFKLQEGYIYGTCEAIYLPEDDYIVEEISTSRFNSAVATATYHGEEITVIDTEENNVTVPLKLSTYKSGDIGYEAVYCSATFENLKSDWSRYSHSSILVNKTVGSND